MPPSAIAAPDEALRIQARELADRTRREQGLPPKIEDLSVLARVASLIDSPP